MMDPRIERLLSWVFGIPTLTHDDRCPVCRDRRRSHRRRFCLRWGPWLAVIGFVLFLGVMEGLIGGPLR